MREEAEKIMRLDRRPSWRTKAKLETLEHLSDRYDVLLVLRAIRGALRTQYVLQARSADFNSEDVERNGGSSEIFKTLSPARCEDQVQPPSPHLFHRFARVPVSGLGAGFR